MKQTVIRDPGGNSPVRLISNQQIVDGSILLVPPNTRAIFCVNGIESEPYPPGRHEIYTGVSPFFVRFRNLMTNGDPGITCQVFYVNIVQEICYQDGTGDIVFAEKRFDISMKAKAAFTARYVITNPKQFVSKLVGMHNNTLYSEDIQPAIRSMILPIVKETISASLGNSRIHDVQGNLRQIGCDVHIRLVHQIAEYGMSLKAIAINAINICDEDMKRLNQFEDQSAEGYLKTKLERHNLNEIWEGNVDKRTTAEFITGSRYHGSNTENSSRDANGVNSMANSMALLPMQFAIGKAMAEQFFGGSSNPFHNAAGVESTSISQPSSMAGDIKKMPPPPVMVRKKICTNCGKDIDEIDKFCKFCGKEM